MRRVTEAVMGLSLPWAAPELVLAADNAEASAAFTERSDVYSMGCILFELITLEEPWQVTAKKYTLAAVRY